LVKGIFFPGKTDKFHSKITAIIPAYYRERTKNVIRQVELLTKCNFIERIVISNHNPIIKYEQEIDNPDKRIEIIDHKNRRRCGHQWEVVKSFQPDFIFSIGDDMLLFPSQLVKVLEMLHKYPDVPHGVAGWYGKEYRQNQEACVNWLTQFYAITKKHLNRYFELVDAISSCDEEMKDIIEFYGNDLIIRKTGSGLSRIHKVGVIIQDRTSIKPGVATFTYDGFMVNRKKISQLLKAVSNQK
jgi:hypothetical protein